MLGLRLYTEYNKITQLLQTTGSTTGQELRGCPGFPGLVPLQNGFRMFKRFEKCKQPGLFVISTIQIHVSTLWEQVGSMVVKRVNGGNPDHPYHNYTLGKPTTYGTSVMNR